jgi:hypothetical protein
LAQLDEELSREGRPDRTHFESQVKPVVELTLSAFWGDDTITPIADVDTGVRVMMTGLIPPHMFPPGIFYAVQLDEVAILVVGAEFDWTYWEQVDDDRPGKPDE